MHSIAIFSKSRLVAPAAYARIALETSRERIA